MDPRTAELLQRLIRHTGRSLLQYVADSDPWAPGSDQATLDKIMRLVEEEREALSSLTGFLRKNRVPPPHLGPYPEFFTTLNFLSLDRLLALLVDLERRAIAELQDDLGRVEHHDARHRVGQLLEMKRRHLAALQEMQGSLGFAGTRV
jgi:hypothetical protein